MTKHTILFLAANPLGTDRLALDEEARAIQAELERSGHRDQFELVTRWAVRPLDLLRVIVSPTLTVIGHIGDSRAYLLRDGKLKALTRDHSPVQELIDMGDLTIRGAKRHPKRHALFRYLGVPRGDFPDVMEQPLKPGDRLLLCSDGLHGYTPESSIRRALATRGGPELIAQRMMGLALRGEAPDNVSAVVVAVEGVAMDGDVGRRRLAPRRGSGPPR